MRIHTLYSVLRMKRGGCSTLLAAAAMLLCAPAESQASSTSWVDGVSVSSGWSDFDKGIASNDGDNNLCWAASASCIIDYWQSLYITASTIPTGEAIWTRFKEACTKDLTGNQLYGIQWWLAGDYSGSTLRDSDKSNDRAAFDSKTTINPIPEYSGSFAGYYWDVIPDTYGNTSTLGPEAAHIRDFLWYANGPEDVFSTTLIERLVSAPIGLGIMDTNKRLAHAITLWGVEYEGNTISSIWITDSDDYTKSIREIQTDLIEVGSNTYVRLIDYSDNNVYGDVYIVGAYGINTAESDTWALERVPEPTTTILTLSAFVLLCSRCRRKQ